MSTAEERMQNEIDELEQENRLLRARNTRLEAKQWIGLTEEQKLSLEIQGGKSDVMLAELVEGWLKEKNT
jgi:very-short-patch-repair endonuclease